jgi:hypothetical protein
MKWKIGGRNLRPQGIEKRFASSFICFTEQGVTMLSCILNTARAIEVNIRIIRVFTKMREILSDQKDLIVKIEQIEKNLLKQGGRMQKNEEDIQIIFKTLKALLKPPNDSRPRVGFRRSRRQLPTNSCASVNEIR